MFVFIVTAFLTFITPLKPKTEALLLDDVIFTCKGMGEPTIAYEWLYYTNGSSKLLVNNYFNYTCNCYGVTEKINPVDGTHIQRGIDSDSGSSYLEIVGVTLADQGSYICVIKTSAGTKKSTSVLEVSEPGSFLAMCMYVHANVY